jgi:hypothetical protein
MVDITLGDGGMSALVKHLVAGAFFISTSSVALADDYIVQDVSRSHRLDGEGQVFVPGARSSRQEICSLLDHPVFDRIDDLGDLQIPSLSVVSDLIFTNSTEDVRQVNVDSRIVSAIAADVSSCSADLIRREKKAGEFAKSAVTELRLQQTNYGGAIFTKDRAPYISVGRSGYFWLLLGFQPALNSLKQDFDAQSALQEAEVQNQKQASDREAQIESDRLAAESASARQEEARLQAAADAEERAVFMSMLFDRLKTAALLIACIAFAYFVKPFIRNKLGDGVA